MAPGPVAPRPQGREVFRSGPVDPAPDTDALAIHCSDPRYQPHFQQFLNSTLGPGRYGAIAVPGGPQFLALTDYLPKFSWAGWRWVKFMVDLAHPKRILLIAHDDCRWYHDNRFLQHGEPAPVRQREDLRSVRASLAERFGQASIELYFARIDGERAAFEEVLP